MSEPEQVLTARPENRPWWLRPRVLGAALAAALLLAMALDTTYISADEDSDSSQDAAFDPQTYAEDSYETEVVPAVQESAVDLPELLAALEEDEEAAGAEHGNRDGTGSPYSFAVRGTGEAGEAESGQLPVEVDGLPDDVAVAIQTGPAISGTALRDATGLVAFDQFTNQIEYREAATALNDQARQHVLDALDFDALAGEEIAFTGAFSRVNPALVLITPVELEVVS